MLKSLRERDVVEFREVLETVVVSITLEGETEQVCESALRACFAVDDYRDFSNVNRARYLVESLSDRLN